MKSGSNVRHVQGRFVKKSGIEAHKSRMGLLFTAPWILGLLLFYAYPLLSSIYYSFTSYSVLNRGTFVGLANYKELVKDNLFWKSIWNTLYFTALSVPVNIILGIVIALLLNSRIRLIGLYRTVFFIPTLVPGVLTVALFRFMNSWNDFLGPLLYLSDEKRYTLSIGLQMFTTQYKTEWSLLMATALMITLPVIIIYFIVQKRFIEGITFSGIKG